MPVSSICILGRQPKLGLAELESVFGAEYVRPVGSTAALVEAPIRLDRFGGQLKAAKLLTILETTDFDKLIAYVRKTLPTHLNYIPDGKIKLGLSFYDFDIPPSKINAAALSLKKVVKSAGRSVRIAPNTEPALSTAQTVHNQLTSPVGMELLFVRDGNTTILAQTTEVQNLADYTRRDRGRPKRDAFVGMLPPKLAQIMVNLGVSDTDPIHGGVLLDPFCGTGVILQEASLMGFDIYGTDISTKMIDYSDRNLMWLMDQPGSRITTTTANRSDPDWRYFKLEQADATSHQWSPHPNFVVCEGYLGQPMSQVPPQEKLQEIIHECDGIMRGFLKNIAPQLKPGTRLCIGAPAWFVGGKIRHLPALDKLKELGLTRVAFTYASNEDLIYHREDQIVGRELVVLIKK